MERYDILDARSPTICASIYEEMRSNFGFPIGPEETATPPKSGGVASA